MAGADIDQIGVKLTANTDPLAKGLDKGAGMIGRFGSKVSAGFDKFANVGKKVAAIGTGAAAAMVATGAMMTKSALESIDATGKLADELGIATDKLVGYQHAAGLSGTKNETLTKGMQRLARRIGEAKAGFGEGVKGLELLGLTAADVADLDTADALELVADKISGIEDPTVRAASAYKLFGRQGQELMNFLMMGKDGLQGATEETKKLGKSFDDIDAAKVYGANDAMLRAGSVIEGIGNQLAIGLAPYIEVAADKFTELATSGEGVSGKVFPALEMVGKGVGGVADVLDVLNDTFHFVQAGVTKGLGLQLRSWEMLGKGVEAYLNLLPGVELTFSDTIGAMADDLDKLAGEQWDKAKNEFNKPPPSEGLSKFFDNVKAQADEAAKKLVASKMAADENAKAFEDMLEGVKKFEELEKFASGIEDDLKSPLDKLEEKIAKLQEAGAKGLLESPAVEKAIENAREEFRSGLDLPTSPLDEFEDKAGKLQEAFGAGLIDEGEFREALESLGKDAVDSIDIESKKADQGPAGLSRGTAEAFRAIVSSQQGGERPMEAIKRSSEQGVAIQQRMEGLLRDIKVSSRKQTKLKQAKIGP